VGASLTARRLASRLLGMISRNLSGVETTGGSKARSCKPTKALLHEQDAPSLGSGFRQTGSLSSAARAQRGGARAAALITAWKARGKHASSKYSRWRTRALGIHRSRAITRPAWSAREDLRRAATFAASSWNVRSGEDLQRSLAISKARKRSWRLRTPGCTESTVLRRIVAAVDRQLEQNRPRRGGAG